MKSESQRISKKSWITVGILLLVVLIGADGCSASKATPAATTPAPATTQQPTTQGQAAQGQRVRNPALQAAMEIRRLQSDTQNALTSDQKDKLKPILQELISTSDPSQEVLQQKADAINAVLTDQQKTALTKARTPNGNNQNANSGTASPTQKTPTQGGGGTGAGTGGKQAGSQVTPQAMYQQVLDSLK